MRVWHVVILLIPSADRSYSNYKWTWCEWKRWTFLIFSLCYKNISKVYSSAMHINSNLKLEMNAEKWTIIKVKVQYGVTWPSGILNARLILDIVSFFPNSEHKAALIMFIDQQHILQLQNLRCTSWATWDI